MKRLSTLSFGRRACDHIPGGPALRAALDLPVVPDILDTMDAHDGARFFILACYQSIKSAAGQLRLARNHWLRPRNTGWYSPTEDFAKKFAEDKLNPHLEALFERPTSPFYGIAPNEGRPALAKLRGRYIEDAAHRILSAERENDRTGLTLADIYIDEPHRYEFGWLEQISNRRGSHNESGHWSETYMSTGLTRGATEDGAPRGAEAAALWETTDQRTWHVRCPACKKYFEPRYLHREKPDDDESPIIGGLIYEKHKLENGLPNEAAIARTLRYQCPHCREGFADTSASRVQLSGTAEKQTGLYVARNASPSLRTFGWTFNAIAIRPWLPLVIRFEKAQLARTRGDLEPLAKFIREELAGIWDPEKYLRVKKSTPVGLTPYALGTDWPDEALDPFGRPVRACTCDVQHDRFIYVIRMWSKDGRSRLRACGVVTSPSGLRDALLAHAVIPERVYLDGRHDPDYVKKIAALMGWRVMMGDKEKTYYHTATGLRRIFSEPRAEDAFAGTAHARGTVLVYMFSKQSALNRLQILRTAPTVDTDLRWTVANDAPAWYLKEIDAHYRVKKRTPEGQDYFVWQGLHDDHAGDCEAMQVVFASMAGLIGSESIETAAEDQKKAA